VIGAYQVVSRLGSGGMGTVYLARDGRGAPVAIKVIRWDLAADPEFRERFRDEVAAARRVAPFCTAQVLDADPDARRPYLVTEYIDGVRLDDVVTESGPLPLSTLQGVAIGVASALTAIHRAGIVHRDLKPSNVMLSFSGPRVIDFGIARALDSAQGLTQTGLVLGSVGWMAPEQMEGAPLGPAVDVFAWGLLIAYAALGGHPYGEGTYTEMSEKILRGRPDLRGVPADLVGVVSAALARDPRARPSAERLLNNLLGEKAPSGGDTRVAATALLDGTWPGSRSAAAAAAGAAGAAGAGLGAAAGAAAARARYGGSASSADGGCRPAAADVAGAPDPTRVANSARQRNWWEDSAPRLGERWWDADDPADLPPPAGPPVPPPDLAGLGADGRGPNPGADRASGRPAGFAPGQGGFGDPAGPGRRRRRGGFVQYEDEPPAPRQAATGRPDRADPVAAARPPAADRRQPSPQGRSRRADQPYPPAQPRQRVQPYPPAEPRQRAQPYRDAEPRRAQPYAPAEPPQPARREQPGPRLVAERPERREREADRYDEPAPRPRRRRRLRLRIPFKKTILFVLLVLLLLSAADQIASMVDQQRTRLWNKVATSVQDGVNDHLDHWWNQTKKAITGSSDGK
jgi:predicted Ser/Thr protein kinase